MVVEIWELWPWLVSLEPVQVGSKRKVAGWRRTNPHAAATPPTVMSTPASWDSSISHHLRATKGILQGVIFDAEYVSSDKSVASEH